MAAAGLVKDLDEVDDPTLQRLRKPQDHRQARHLHAAFELADERFVRTAEIRKGVLREAAVGAQLAEALAEDDAFRLRLDRHA